MKVFTDSSKGHYADITVLFLKIGVDPENKEEEDEIDSAVWALKEKKRIYKLSDMPAKTKLEIIWGCDNIVWLFINHFVIPALQSKQQ